MRKYRSSIRLLNRLLARCLPAMIHIYIYIYIYVYRNLCKVITRRPNTFDSPTWPYTVLSRVPYALVQLSAPWPGPTLVMEAISQVIDSSFFHRIVIVVWSNLCTGFFKNKEAYAKPALAKTMDKLFFADFPYMPGVKQKSDFQVGHNQFRQPGPNKWKSKFLKPYIIQS